MSSSLTIKDRQLNEALKGLSIEMTNILHLIDKCNDASVQIRYI